MKKIQAIIKSLGTKYKDMIKRYRMRIDSRETLQEAAELFGLLPFFPNEIRGLSVAEMCSPGKLFGGNVEEGCWEWKGPVIRKKTTAYGKFFNRKAGFVSLDLVADFFNYRRNLFPVKEGSIDEMLLEIIRENDSLTSTELRRLIFGGKKRTEWDELPSSDDFNLSGGGRKSLESPLHRLQMGGWIIISDFEYKVTRSGERYGWGVARYSTPENVFGELILGHKGSPKQSYDFLIKKIKEKIPLASEGAIGKLIGIKNTSKRTK